MENKLTLVQVVEAIQKAEANAWLRLNVYEHQNRPKGDKGKEWDYTDDGIQVLRAEWAALDGLKISLKIPDDIEIYKECEKYY